MKVKLSLYFFYCICITACVDVQNTAQTLNEKIDAIVGSMYVEGEPGVSILVAKNGKPLHRKAYGMAELELGVLLTPESVFQIGSISKQFTAVAILMLEEQGKLNVNDDITKYIPDYPSGKKKITIHHLLNHTSGIKNYTNMENFFEIKRDYMSPLALIDFFKNEELDFDPGTEFKYSNSGYVLLGHIIELVSGETYGDYIEKSIFKKIGMNSSYYGGSNELMMNRASGYQQGESGFVNAAYFNLTVAYAAGAIMSTVDDLLIWQNAISNNALIKQTSLNKAVNGSTLSDGKKIAYGYGWSEIDFRGSKGYTHSGGIDGYTTNGLFLENENVYIIGLSNCRCTNVTELTMKIASLVLGKPLPSEADAISLPEAELVKWVGTYQFAENDIRYISLKEGKLFSRKEGGRLGDLELFPMEDGSFMFDRGIRSYVFSTTEEGKREVFYESFNGSETGVEIDKEAPPERKSISLPSTTLQRYIGKYELQENFILTVTVDDSSIFTQVTGQSKVEVLAETETLFFVKDFPAEITFNINDEGLVDSLTLEQGGRQTIAKKID